MLSGWNDLMRLDVNLENDGNILHAMGGGGCIAWQWRLNSILDIQTSCYCIDIVHLVLGH